MGRPGLPPASSAGEIFFFRSVVLEPWLDCGQSEVQDPPINLHRIGGKGPSIGVCEAPAQALTPQFPPRTLWGLTSGEKLRKLRNWVGSRQNWDWRGKSRWRQYGTRAGLEPRTCLST